jgi:hypothetical protein
VDDKDVYEFIRWDYCPDALSDEWVKIKLYKAPDREDWGYLIDLLLVPNDLATVVEKERPTWHSPPSFSGEARSREQAMYDRISVLAGSFDLLQRRLFDALEQGGEKYESRYGFLSKLDRDLLERVDALEKKVEELTKHSDAKG